MSWWTGTLIAVVPRGLIHRVTVLVAVLVAVALTSPYDDANNPTDYFSRYWPNHDQIHCIVVESDSAFELVTKDDRHLHNAEVLTLRRLVNVHVHFGAARDTKGAFLPMQRSAA